MKHYVSSKLARQLYFAFIYPQIRYGIESFGSCSNKLMAKLQTIQNKLLKLLLRLPFRTRTNTLHKDLKILKVKDIYNCSLNLFVHDCLNHNCSSALWEYFQPSHHQHVTRQRNKLTIKHSRTSIGTSRVIVKAALEWNSISKDLTKLDKNPLKNNLIKQYISMYEESEI